jgi:hypothetical protein
MIESLEHILEKFLQDNWTATPIAFDNVQFNEVRDIPFIRMQTEWADSYYAGVNRERFEGYIFITIYVAANQGIKESAELADEIINLYKALTEPHLIIKAARNVRIGQIKEWYQRNVVIPFQYDNCL